MDTRVLSGHVELRAGLLKGDWTATVDEKAIGSLALRSRKGEAAVRLADGTRWTLTSDGWGVVRAIEAEVPFVRATRDRPEAGHWQLTGPGIDYHLVPSGLRRWELRAAGRGPAGVVRQALAPRTVTVDLETPTQTVVVLLAWMAVVAGMRSRSGPSHRPARNRPEPSPDTAL